MTKNTAVTDKSSRIYPRIVCAAYLKRARGAPTVVAVSTLMKKP